MSNGAPPRPRIDPGRWRELGPVNGVLVRMIGVAAGSRWPGVFATMGKHRGLFRGWLMFAGRMMPGGTVSSRETEMLIIRVAHLRGCEYELQHHVKRGRRYGIDEQAVRRIIDGPDAAGHSERERVLLQVVDELHADGDLSDERWAQLRAHYDERQAMEVILLVGHYEMLATFLITLRVTPDH